MELRVSVQKGTDTAEAEAPGAFAAAMEDRAARRPRSKLEGRNGISVPTFPGPRRGLVFLLCDPCRLFGVGRSRGISWRRGLAAFSPKLLLCLKVQLQFKLVLPAVAEG